MPALIKIHQDVRSLPGGDFNAGNGGNIPVLAHFQGARDVIMIGDGHPHTQGPRPPGNLLNVVAAIGAAGVKMHVEHGIIFAQKRKIRFFKKDSFVVVVHRHFTGFRCLRSGLAQIPDNHKPTCFA